MTSRPTEERILEQLQVARDELPEWREVLALQIALLEAQMSAGTPQVVAALRGPEATQRQRQGIPLVTAADVQVDWEAFANLYQQVCRLAAEHRPDLSEEFEQLGGTARDDPDRLREWMNTFLIQGGQDAEDAGGLRAFTLTHTLRPFLRGQAASCLSLVSQEGWRREYCPVCGGQPDMAALSASEEGARVLLCSRCDTEWKYQRLGCPFCAADQGERLAYYREEGDLHRLYVCERCKRYLKTVDLRRASGQVYLPVERILTLPMDVAAREAGYH